MVDQKQKQLPETTKNLVKISSGIEIDTNAKVYIGKLSKVFFNTNNFVVAKISGVVCTGKMPKVAMNAKYTLKGGFEYNKKYNDWQFCFTEYEVEINVNSGLIEFLTKEGPGVGPKIAVSIVNQFRDRTMHVLEHQPFLLKSIRGLSENKIEELHQWAIGETNNVVVKQKLYDLDLTKHKVDYLIKVFGNDAERKIKENCFKLTEIHGFGFKTAAKIADALGVPQNDPGRIRAAVIYAINEINQEGHVCVARSELTRKAVELLGLTQEFVSPQIDKMLEDMELLDENTDFKEYAEGMGILYP